MINLGECVLEAVDILHPGHCRACTVFFDVASLIAIYAELLDASVVNFYFLSLGWQKLWYCLSYFHFDPQLACSNRDHCRLFLALFKDFIWEL